MSLLIVVRGEHDVASSISQLDESHILRLVDMELSMANDYERFEVDKREENHDPKVEEVDDPVETQTNIKKIRSTKYVQ